MKEQKTDRRIFIRNTAVTAAAVTLSGKTALGSILHAPAKNLLPRWKGFNLLDYFYPSPGRNQEASRTTEDDLRWMTDWGFDFVRLPIAYPRYLDFDRSKQITKDDFYKI